MDSTGEQQILHIDWKLKPLLTKSSLVGNLSCIILHTKRELERGTYGDQIVLAQ